MQTVYIVHEGSHNYLKQSIQFLRTSGNYTSLIGTCQNLGSLCSEFWDSNKIFSKDYEIFRKNYIHMSSNSEKFELQCFKRYFNLLQVARDQKKECFWMIDSDVLVFTNLSKFGEEFLIKRGYHGALSTPVQAEMDWASSPHVSLWTLESLSNFVSYLSNIYINPILFRKFQLKYKHHLDNQIPGGVCDMTALFLWQLENKKNIYNISRAHLEHGLFFDHNINLSSNYHHNEFKKNRLLDIKYIYKNKLLYFVKKRYSEEQVQIACLHFQGAAKKFIRLLSGYKKINYVNYLNLKLINSNIFLSTLWYTFLRLLSLKYLIEIRKKSSTLDFLINGEILDDDFYNHLSILSKNIQIKNFLEIGSSSGGGSTKAFVDAINQRCDKDQVNFYSIELSAARFQALTNTYKNYSFFKAYNFSSVSLVEFPSKNQIINFYIDNHTNLNRNKLGEILKWYKQDLNYVEKSLHNFNGINQIKKLQKIDYFDFVLIDGSEFTGESELSCVMGAKIIALDDTESYKCYKAMQRLKLSEDYRQLVHRPDIRNGYAIFARNDFYL